MGKSAVSRRPPGQLRKKPAKVTFHYKVTLDDGTVERTESFPHSELALRWLVVAAVQFCSDDEETKAKGLAELKFAATHLARSEAAIWAQNTAARHERPAAKSRVKERVLGAMRANREMKLKDFLDSWQLSAINGLRCSFEPDRVHFRVSDEDEDHDDALYTYKSLSTMFSKAKKTAG